MSQKVNPHGARVGVIFNWAARWYSSKKDFAYGMVAKHCNRPIMWLKKCDKERTYKEQICVFNSHVKLILNSI